MNEEDSLGAHENTEKKTCDKCKHLDSQIDECKFDFFISQGLLLYIVH